MPATRDGDIPKSSTKAAPSANMGNSGCAMVVLFFLVCTCMSARWLWRMHAVDSSPLTVVGQIGAITGWQPKQGMYKWNVEYTYTVAGKSYTNADNINADEVEDSHGRRLQVGGPITVHYVAADPGICRAEHCWQWGTTSNESVPLVLLLACVGLTFLIVRAWIQQVAEERSAMPVSKVLPDQETADDV